MVKTTINRKTTNPLLIVTIIITVIAIILMGISTAIDGIISLKKSGQLKTTLLAAAATGGFSVIFSIIAAVVAISLVGAIKSKSPRSKSLVITFIVFAAIALILYLADMGLNLTARNNIDMTPSEKTSVTAAIAIMAVGFILEIIAAVLIYRVGSQSGRFVSKKTTTIVNK